MPLDDQAVRSQSRTHVATVDFARGGFACAVMIYHLTHDEGLAHVERVAYYAVYSFFVVSGFSLHLAYRDSIVSLGDVRAYLVRRFFRIAPLFYIALILAFLIGQKPSQYGSKLLLNVTFTFGLANPGANSLLVGGWSIGIEIVFYLVFPFLLIVGAKSLPRMLTIASISVILMVAFINLVLRKQTDMTSALWVTYTQPVAFFGYFASGAVLAEYYLRYPRYKGHAASIALAVLALLPFLLVQPGETLGLLTGPIGFLLMVSTFLFVAAAAFMREPTGVLLVFATWLGAMSYPIYLLHPIVHDLLMRNMATSAWPRLCVATLLTLILSHIVSRCIEHPARVFGRRLSSRAA